MSQVTTGVYQSVQSDPAWRLLFSGATYSDLCCSRRYLLEVVGFSASLHVYSICIGLLRLHVTVPCNSRRFTGQASAGDAHHIMSNSSGPSSSALHGAEHTRVGTIPHWGVFFLTRLLQQNFMQITHSVHSSSGSLLIQAGRVWLSTDVGRNDLSLSGEAEGEDIFFSS